MSKPKTVLVVDDDEVTCDLLKNFLKFSGYECMTALNGQKALDIILSTPPDMVISDIHMPFMNGFQLLRATKRLIPDMPFVFMTQFSHFRRFYSDKTARADGFMEKPFSLECVDNYCKKFLHEEAADV